VRSINPNGVIALAKDVEYLTQFVDSLNVPILRENLDELQQTVQLMQADNADEFYDISTRNKKYGRVDAMQGPILLEKYEFFLSSALNHLLTPIFQVDSNGTNTDQGGQVRESVLAIQEILITRQKHWRVVRSPLGGLVRNYLPLRFPLVALAEYEATFDVVVSDSKKEIMININSSCDSGPNHILSPISNYRYQICPSLARNRRTNKIKCPLDR
jgi:hypothetical protein